MNTKVVGDSMMYYENGKPLFNYNLLDSNLGVITK